MQKDLSQRGRIILLSMMHFFIDSYMGFFAIYLVLASLDPSKAAIIAMISTFAGNILQPFTGYFTDKVRGKLPLAMGLAITPLSMSLIGLTKNYAILLPLVLLGNLGSAIFHPAGAGASGEKSKNIDASFAFFITIGTFGYALSQPIFSVVTEKLGLKSSPVLMIPAIALSVYYVIFSDVRILGHGEKPNFDTFKGLIRNHFIPVLILFYIMVARTAFVSSVNLFAAKTMHDWGFPRSIYSVASTGFMLSGATGILLAGNLTHLIKARNLIIYSLTIFLPFFFLFIIFGKNGSPIPALLMLSLAGFILHCGYGTNIVLGQKLFPEMSSTVSGLLMGFAWATASFGPVVCNGTKYIFKPLAGFPSGLMFMTIFPLSAAMASVFLRDDTDLLI